MASAQLLQKSGAVHHLAHRSHVGEGRLVCGIVTNGGVASTVRDAHVRDYHVIVLSDGCAAFSPQAHQAALADMASVAEVTDSASLLRQLQA